LLLGLNLLAVVAVLGLLAALVIPASIRTKIQAQKQQACLQARQIVSALVDYQSVYGRFPVSADAADFAVRLGEDNTYGALLLETRTWVAGPCYSNNNAELMSALLDLEYFGDGTPTLNAGHAQNPRRTRFLEAALPGGTNALPGVGLDGTYRDPWGGPYFVTVDLNGDGRARDIMYREPAVSQDPLHPGQGLCGLLEIERPGELPVFEAPGPVLVWSAGPNRRIDTALRATEGVNRDNILSCAQ
jgi:type II secretory pathway pseudopilin PulG